MWCLFICSLFYLDFAPQVAQDNDLSDSIKATLLQLTKQSGHLWCGGDKDDVQYGVHFLLHSYDGSDLRIDDALHAVSS